VATDIDRKRNRLTKAYPGYSWHEKVAGMSNEQVIAVFLRFERDGWPKIEPKLNPAELLHEELEASKPEEPDEEQIRLF